jgi:hypothetical protein
MRFVFASRVLLVQAISRELVAINDGTLTTRLVGDVATVGGGRRLCLQALNQLVMFVATIVCRQDDDDGLVVERKSKSAIRKHLLTHSPPIQSRRGEFRCP